MTRRGNFSPVPVHCVETGDRFPSMAAAAEWMRRQGYAAADSKIVSGSVNRGVATFGYHFERLESLDAYDWRDFETEN